MTNKSKKTKRKNPDNYLKVGMITAIIFTSIMVVSSPVQADGEVTDECVGRIDQGTHVWITESHKKRCTFDCNEGDYIVVEVVSEGGRGRVSIVGECEGARTECVNKVRSCDETKGTFLAQKSGEGECRFEVKHYNAVDKRFRCRAISPEGEWENPPQYALCIVHWLDAWILGGTVGGDSVEVCYYEGNVVCLELIGTFELPEPAPWVITCGEDLDEIIMDGICGANQLLDYRIDGCLGYYGGRI